MGVEVDALAEALTDVDQFVDVKVTYGASGKEVLNSD